MKEGIIPNPVLIPKSELETESGPGSKIEESSKKLQEQYLNLVENWIKERRNSEYSYDRKLSDNERILEPIFDDTNKPPSCIDRTREPKNNSIEEQRTTEKVWVVVDFDDVINKTTTYHNFLKEKVFSDIGLDKKEYERLYEESKIANIENKKVLRFNIFIEKIKNMYPGNEEIIDKLFNEDVNMNDFVDQGVKRALLALENSFSEKKDVRISILTFGDINYQKGRIDKTDIVDAVDDIIYTEGSKREVLETLIEKDYKSKGIIPPLVITLDDSKEQIKDYSGVNLRNNFINMHYRNSQGKKSMEESSVDQVVAITEKEKNEAALDFYRICRVCLSPDMHLSREELHNSFNGKDIGNIYRTTEIKSGKKRIKASRIDSTGRLHYIVFNDRDYSKEELESQIMDEDGFTAWDYYNSLEDPIYPTFETNVLYSKDKEDNLIRTFDSHHHKRSPEGILIEDNIYHREDIAKRVGNFMTSYHSDEFIKNAK